MKTSNLTPDPRGGGEVKYLPSRAADINRSRVRVISSVPPVRSRRAAKQIRDGPINRAVVTSPIA